MKKSCNLIIIASICTLGYLTWNNVQEIKDINNRVYKQEIIMQNFIKHSERTAMKYDILEKRLYTITPCNCEDLHFQKIENKNVN